MELQELLDLGLTEEQANSVLASHKKSIDGNYVPKYRFDEKNEENRTIKEQLAERDTQITTLKKFEGTQEELTTKITELEVANKQKDAAYQEETKKLATKNAIRLQLLSDSKNRPHDVDMVAGLFDLTTIVLDETGEKIKSGFQERFDEVVKDKPFLFSKVEDNKPASPFKPVGTAPKDGSSDSSVDTSAAYGKALAAKQLKLLGITPKQD